MILKWSECRSLYAKTTTKIFKFDYSKLRKHPYFS